MIALCYVQVDHIIHSLKKHQYNCVIVPRQVFTYTRNVNIVCPSWRLSTDLSVGCLYERVGLKFKECILKLTYIKYSCYREYVKEPFCALSVQSHMCMSSFYVIVLNRKERISWPMVVIFSTKISNLALFTDGIISTKIIVIRNDWHVMICDFWNMEVAYITILEKTWKLKLESSKGRGYKAGGTVFVS